MTVVQDLPKPRLGVFGDCPFMKELKTPWGETWQETCRVPSSMARKTEAEVQTYGLTRSTHRSVGNSHSLRIYFIK